VVKPEAYLQNFFCPTLCAKNGTKLGASLHGALMQPKEKIDKLQVIRKNAYFV